MEIKCFHRLNSFEELNQSQSNFFKVRGMGFTQIAELKVLSQQVGGIY